MQTLDCQGQVVLVTGAASGIGAACVEAFEASGATVAPLDIAGDTPGLYKADITDLAQLQAVVDDILARHGRLDSLVHSAGIQRYGTPLTLSEDDWNQVLRVNVTGAFLAAKAVLPPMLRQGQGSLVFLGSVQSQTAQRNSVHYVTSKHALLGLTRSLALDFGDQGIRANLLMPGAIDTPMLRWAASRDPNPENVLAGCARLHIRNTLGQPAEVARAAVFLCSPWASFITGAALPVDGGLLVPTGGMASQSSGMGASPTSPD